MTLTVCHALMFGLISAVSAAFVLAVGTAIIREIGPELKKIQIPKFVPVFRPAFAGSFALICLIGGVFLIGKISFVPCDKEDSITKILGKENPALVVASKLPCDCGK